MSTPIDRFPSVRLRLTVSLSSHLYIITAARFLVRYTMTSPSDSHSEGLNPKWFLNLSSSWIGALATRDSISSWSKCALASLSPRLLLSAAKNLNPIQLFGIAGYPLELRSTSPPRVSHTLRGVPVHFLSFCVVIICASVSRTSEI